MGSSIRRISPKIEYIKGTNNLVADVVSTLEYTPSKCISSYIYFMKLLMTKYEPNLKHHVKWKAFSCLYNRCKNPADTIDIVKKIEEQTAGIISCFASFGQEEQEDIYPPTITDILDVQRHNRNLSRYFKCGVATNTKRYKLALLKIKK